VLFRSPISSFGHDGGCACPSRRRKFDAATELSALLRARGLMRTDLDADARVYALSAVTNGFHLVQPLMPGLPEPDLEVRARADCPDRPQRLRTAGTTRPRRPADLGAESHRLPREKPS